MITKKSWETIVSKRTIMKNNKQRDKSTSKTGGKAVKQPYHQYIKNKVWKWIKTKYSSESTKYNEYLNKIKILNPSNAQLKKTPLLILFSIVLLFTTTTTFSDIINSLYILFNNLFVLKDVEKIVKIIIGSMIVITGFLGFIYLARRRVAGLWIIGIFSSILIFPIFLSYKENGFALSQSYFNYFNISMLPYLYYTTSQSIGQLEGINHLYNLHYIVKYSPYSSGIGINIVPIIYLIIVFLLIFQNKKIFTFRKSMVFTFVVVISTLIPVAVYSSFNMVYKNNKNDLLMKAFKLETKNLEKIFINHNTQKNLHDKCYEASRHWFNADDKKMIKEVTCYDEDEKITFTK